MSKRCSLSVCDMFPSLSLPVSPSPPHRPHCLRSGAPITSAFECLPFRPSMERANPSVRRPPGNQELSSRSARWSPARCRPSRVRPPLGDVTAAGALPPLTGTPGARGREKGTAADPDRLSVFSRAVMAVALDCTVMLNGRQQHWSPIDGR